MTAQNMNEKYRFKTDITTMNDEEIFEYARSFADHNGDIRKNLTNYDEAFDEAFALLTYLATERKFAAAQNDLGCLYLSDLYIKTDYKTAVKLFLQASEQGLPEALTNLGDCYMSGSGVRRNRKIAAKLFQQASEQGYTPAQANLGYCLLNTGIKKDTIRGIKLMFMVAAKGDISAQETFDFIPSDTAKVLGGLAKSYHKAVESSPKTPRPSPENYFDQVIAPLSYQILKELNGWKQDLYHDPNS